MPRFLPHVMALLVVLGVVFVFVSPALDLEPTAMRAWQAAQIAIMSVAMSASIMAGLCNLPRVTRLSGDPAIIAGDIVDLVDLNCSRLC